jgi:hypothetical protein
MPEEHVEVAPYFILDEEPANEEQVRQVRQLEHRIGENPEAFRRALRLLGESATAGTMSLGEAETKSKSSIPDQSPRGLLVNLFSRRLDLEIEFDDATENALAANPEHRALIDVHKDTHNILYKVGEMTHKSVDNPNAAPARDAVRRSRVGFFIARTIEYQRQQQRQTTLPAAG